MPGIVKLKPIQAHILTNEETIFHKVNPYVVMTVGDKSVQGSISPVSTNEPTWNDESLQLTHRDEKFCYLTVKDKHKIRDDKMLGVAVIDIQHSPHDQASQMWFDLFLKQHSVGKILIELTVKDDIDEPFGVSISNSGVKTRSGRKIDAFEPKHDLRGHPGVLIPEEVEKNVFQPKHDLRGHPANFVPENVDRQLFVKGHPNPLVQCDDGSYERQAVRPDEELSRQSLSSALLRKDEDFGMNDYDKMPTVAEVPSIDDVDIKQDITPLDTDNDVTRRYLPKVESGQSNNQFEKELEEAVEIMEENAHLEPIREDREPEHFGRDSGIRHRRVALAAGGDTLTEIVKTMEHSGSAKVESRERSFRNSEKNVESSDKSMTKSVDNQPIPESLNRSFIAEESELEAMLELPPLIEELLEMQSKVDRLLRESKETEDRVKELDMRRDGLLEKKIEEDYQTPPNTPANIEDKEEIELVKSRFYREAQNSREPVKKSVFVEEVYQTIREVDTMKNDYQRISETRRLVAPERRILMRSVHIPVEEGIRTTEIDNSLTGLGLRKRARELKQRLVHSMEKLIDRPVRDTHIEGEPHHTYDVFIHGARPEASTRRRIFDGVDNMKARGSNTVQDIKQKSLLAKERMEEKIHDVRESIEVKFYDIKEKTIIAKHRMDDKLYNFMERTENKMAARQFEREQRRSEERAMGVESSLTKLGHKLEVIKERVVEKFRHEMTDEGTQTVIAITGVETKMSDVYGVDIAASRKNQKERNERLLMEEKIERAKMSSQRGHSKEKRKRSQNRSKGKKKGKDDKELSELRNIANKILKKIDRYEKGESSSDEEEEEEGILDKVKAAKDELKDNLKEKLKFKAKTKAKKTIKRKIKEKLPGGNEEEQEEEEDQSMMEKLKAKFTRGLELMQEKVGIQVEESSSESNSPVETKMDKLKKAVNINTHSDHHHVHHHQVSEGTQTIEGLTNRTPLSSVQGIQNKGNELVSKIKEKVNDGIETVKETIREVSTKAEHDEDFVKDNYQMAEFLKNEKETYPTYVDYDVTEDEYIENGQKKGIVLRVKEKITVGLDKLKDSIGIESGVNQIDGENMQSTLNEIKENIIKPKEIREDDFDVGHELSHKETHTLHHDQDPIQTVGSFIPQQNEFAGRTIPIDYFEEERELMRVDKEIEDELHRTVEPVLILGPYDTHEIYHEEAHHELSTAEKVKARVNEYARDLKGKLNDVEIADEKEKPQDIYVREDGTTTSGLINVLKEKMITQFEEIKDMINGHNQLRTDPDEKVEFEPNLGTTGAFYDDEIPNINAAESEAAFSKEEMKEKAREIGRKVLEKSVHLKDELIGQKADLDTDLDNWIEEVTHPEAKIEEVHQAPVEDYVALDVKDVKEADAPVIESQPDFLTGDLPAETSEKITLEGQAESSEQIPELNTLLKQVSERLFNIGELLDEPKPNVGLGPKDNVLKERNQQEKEVEKGVGMKEWKSNQVELIDEILFSREEKENLPGRMRVTIKERIIGGTIDPEKLADIDPHIYH